MGRAQQPVVGQMQLGVVSVVLMSELAVGSVVQSGAHLHSEVVTAAALHLTRAA